MVERLRQQPHEDDEAFLLRAERAMASEQETIRTLAQTLVAAAVRTVDKPESLRHREVTVNVADILRNAPRYIELRALLLARSQCRELQEMATGADSVAAEAYKALSKLALAATSRRFTE
jgi:hypothetical protein